MNGVKLDARLPTTALHVTEDKPYTPIGYEEHKHEYPMFMPEKIHRVVAMPSRYLAVIGQLYPDATFVVVRDPSHRNTAVRTTGSGLVKFSLLMGFPAATSTRPLTPERRKKEGIWRLLLVTRDWPSGGVAKMVCNEEGRATISEVKSAFGVLPEGREIWEYHPSLCKHNLIRDNDNDDDDDDDDDSYDNDNNHDHDGSDGDESTNVATGRRGKRKAKAVAKATPVKRRGKGKAVAHTPVTPRRSPRCPATSRQSCLVEFKRIDPNGPWRVKRVTGYGDGSSPSENDSELGTTPCKHHKLIRGYEGVRSGDDGAEYRSMNRYVNTQTGVLSGDAYGQAVFEQMGFVEEQPRRAQAMEYLQPGVRWAPAAGPSNPPPSPRPVSVRDAEETEPEESNEEDDNGSSDYESSEYSDSGTESDDDLAHHDCPASSESSFSPTVSSLGGLRTSLHGGRGRGGASAPPAQRGQGGRGRGRGCGRGRGSGRGGADATGSEAIARGSSTRGRSRGRGRGASSARGRGSGRGRGRGRGRGNGDGNEVA
ncbi:hypothetical protein B0T26DRAFT_719678 [Lasiosphaeria miniovina]|uniref:Uncharacterized protein n=1 Tax=Lasiosphaeria miniovina TaxID=1954250 RepID=A0AA40AE00_9PEZI|nr:uncharacterized protein B0T26DRAFT_719678 [Lasiosphaeria miniovina]KAK0714149.1 hypothetical protein B0T26DRAFT_719678 [Lasiosphaeria miniovina]